MARRRLALWRGMRVLHRKTGRTGTALGREEPVNGGPSFIGVRWDDGDFHPMSVHVNGLGRVMSSPGRKNPFNATKPPEWETMSKKLRKAWNRKHWRPEQWKCDLALKKEATRQKHRGERAGKGLLTLAEKMAKSNPSRDLGDMLDRDPTVRELLKYDRLAEAYKRASSSSRMRILSKLSDAAERGRTIRRANPKRDGSPTRGERKARASRERRKFTGLSSRDRARIEREETASGYSINPRRRRRR